MVVESLFNQTRVEAETSSSVSMSRDQLMAGIMAVNPSASAEFLASFERDTLAGYFERLHRLHGVRGERWVRPVGEPAMSCHTPRL